MKNQVLSLLFIMISVSFGFSQSGDLEKRLKKVDGLIEKNKLEKAGERLEGILVDYSYYGKGWDLLSKIRRKEWQDSQSMDSFMKGAFTVTVEGGGDKESDELANSLVSLLNEMRPSLVAYDTYIYTLRMATLKSNTAYYSAILLRNEKVVVVVDTNLTEKASAYFEEGEKAFHNKNYHKAALNYQKAVEEQPNFYKARLYLGDSYYFTGDYMEAIEKFKLAKDQFPNMLEPRKYLVDAYAKEGLYPNCLEEAIRAFTVYPDISMYAKLKDAAVLSGKNIELEWTQRACFPNTMKSTHSQILIEDEKSAWFYYQSSKVKLKEYCDENGKVSKENGWTKAKYLEVFSWEQMIEHSAEDELLEAKKMQELGYLDCYVLVTCFHQDFYNQYTDFAVNNEEKIIEYFNAFIK